jgi:acetyltransferase-like isoleucine patch superfamily enzyme
MSNTIAEDFKHGKNFKCGNCVIIYPDVIVGDDVKLGNHVVLRSGTRMGNDIDFADYCMTSGAALFGDHFSARAGCLLTQGTIVEDDVFMGGAVMTNHAIHVTHRRPQMKSESFMTRIGAGAVIGSRTFISPGCHIAPLTIVGSNSNVYKMIAEPGIYVGSPARKIKDVPPETIIPISPRRLMFDDEVRAKYLSRFIWVPPAF